MKVNSLNLISFRNYKNLSIDFFDGVNVIVGNNARGKTNLMEAICYSISLKSLKKSPDRELIKLDSSEGYIGANIFEAGLSKFIEIKFLSSKNKRVRINRNEIKSMREMDIRSAVVSFIPEDLNIIKGSPSQRRDYLDDILSKVFPIYRYNLSRYLKIIYERNNLLKSYFMRNEIDRLLDIYDVELVKYGKLIYEERFKLLNELNETVPKVIYDISDGKEKVELSLLSDLSDENFLIKLKNNRAIDLQKKYTSLGSHRDDIFISLNDLDARKFSSQGQQRTIVLALKLCELKYIEEKLGEKPILILDDVFSELDEKRCKKLVESFEDSQVFISATEMPEGLEVEHKVYKIGENGEFIIHG